MATITFAVNFSVWTLYSVMSIELTQQLNLSGTQIGILLSAPILTGALLRLPVGILCERYSSKTLMIIQMLLIVLPLFLLPKIESYLGYVCIGALIGISGVSFTIGIRYLTDWFDSNEQGTAMGVFGAGNAGAALSFILIPYIQDVWGWQYIGPAYSVMVLVSCLAFWLIAPNTPRFITNKQQKDLAFYIKPLGQAKVWRFGLYYYFVFGSFLALILWLPQYYVNAYKLPFNQAMALTLLFVISSSMARAAGGWLADRFGARQVNWNVFWICLVCLFFLSYPPTTMTIHGVEKDVELSIELNVWIFTFLLLVIGLAQGFGRASVYKLINDYYPEQMGSVGGMVAMLGALGGCTLPVLFGFVVDTIGVYSACFMLLYGVLATCMLLMHLAIKRERYQQRISKAQEYNFLDMD
ncbi:nitrate/nitrite transporter [uncultured Paraglaciecola sp.]|jgi:NNP family nitrate/nitrite transporter-like MFS transporter|uniref:MFS transporter n=1 Tax=uncultured Paraglaciecola sp. TaxID=1765024 RepID=UPI0025F310D6|nr:nitrate/nitrite transporter [uncultured Paraglaciecola sp.]